MDPSGHWVESLIDIASIVYDVVDIATNGLNWENGLSLVADVVSLALPVVAGGGMMVRAATHVDDVVDASKAIDTAVDIAQTANQADNATDFIRVVPTDQVGTSQPFKTRCGEDGLSVFRGVSSEEILSELPGRRVPNTTVNIPGRGLPQGTQVINTPADNLSQRLSDAHQILVRPEGWSVDRFAQALKSLVGWE